jgi:hypothetical protein
MEHRVLCTQATEDAEMRRHRGALEAAREGDGDNPHRARGTELGGAGREGGAGGQDVVDQEDAAGRRAARADPWGRPEALGAAAPDLTIAATANQATLQRSFEARRQRRRQLTGRIEAAAS